MSLISDLGREMQVFLAGYIIISICEIFSVGGFPLNPTARVVRVQVNPLKRVKQSSPSLLNNLAGL